MLINYLALANMIINIMLLGKTYKDYLRISSKDIYNSRECLAFVGLCLALSFLIIAAYFSPSELILSFTLGLSLVVMQFANPFLLLIFLRFIGINNKRYILMKRFLMLSPALAMIFFVTNPFHHMYIQNVTRDIGFIGVNESIGPLGYLLSIYNGVVLTISFLYSLFNYKNYKYQDKRVIISMFLVLIFATIFQGMDNVIKHFTGHNFFFTIIVMSFVVMFLCYVNFGYLKTSRSKAMEVMDEVYVLFDTNGEFCEANRNGEMFFIEFFKNPHPTLSTFLAFIGLENTSIDDMKSHDFGLPYMGGQKYFNVSKIPLDRSDLSSYCCGFIIKEITVFQEKMMELSNEASKDPLTGANNRRYFLNYMRKTFADSKTPIPITLIMLDIDFFKKINDTYGHTAGDEVLKLFTERCLDNLRGDDILCRYGGEEFIIACKNLDEQKGIMVAKRVLHAINSKDFVLRSVIVSVTASIGVVTFNASVDTDLQHWIGLADQCLYKAKESGRNRVIYLSNKKEREKAGVL